MMTNAIKLEHLALGCFAILLYWLAGHGWLMFAILILAPDLSFAGYKAGPKFGAWCYNATHSWIGPVILGTFSLSAEQPAAEAVALIWAAHIGLDRALGYGLKHESGFSDTHLGRIGRKGD